MASKFAMCALLALMFTMAMSGGKKNETSAEPLTSEAFTKYVHSVPIYNYQWFHQHAKKGSSINEKDAAPYTTWLIKVHDEKDQKMRDFCASTEFGKRHCLWVLESMSSFHLNGTEDELTVFLNDHSWMVEFVEPDSEQSINPETPELPGVVQRDPYWGLDRIDAKKCVGGAYRPGLDGGYGTGVNAYVLDTGVRISHDDFEGRAFASFDSTSGRVRTCSPRDNSCAADRQGHGSHCAGVVGGTRYGVAKNVRIWAGKVLGDSGSGSTSGIIAGMDYVVASGQKPALMSMSLGGSGRGSYYIRAIDSAVSKGVPVVVAAGNDNSNACNFQPAYVPGAITVGSTTNPRDSGCTDKCSWFSNYGPCVDIWAPGSDITSVGHRCNTCSAVMSGTSMACPAVAGATALILAAYPGIAASRIEGLLKQHATTIRIIGERGYSKPQSTTDFLYIGRDWAVGGNFPRPTPRPTPAPTPPPAPASCNPSACAGLTCKNNRCCAPGDWGCCGAKSNRLFCPAIGDKTKMCTNGGCATPSYNCQAKYGTTPCYNTCNPSSCFGLTCKSGRCCYYGDWDCCGSGNAKYSNRKYCPTFGDLTILCRNGACVSDVNLCATRGGVVHGSRECGWKGSSLNGSSQDMEDLDMQIQQAAEKSAQADQSAQEASTQGKLLQVSMGIFAVVGIIMGIKWHKSLAREVKLQPYLG